ncbi:MAG: ABC transporter ATP-binding protein [Spirochaetaceae bacterium]|nr:ABC transporter ATP-binding protein [Spirochaetaceae bacterium]
MSDIRLQGVGKSYAGRAVLEGLDLEVRSGECFTILGPSGCGKTVLLRLIAGFESPDAGRISIGGRAVADSGRMRPIPPEDRRIAVVFQDYAVWPHKTVLGNVAYPLEIRGAPKGEARVRALAGVDQVGLGGLHDRMPYQLSGGQQQRVALARALVSGPEVMLLDEPLSNLDANLREEMRFEIRELQRGTGATLVYVTHDQEVALAISDRIAVMDRRGRLRQIGSPAEIFEKPADAFVFKFMGIANTLPVEFEGGPRIRGSRAPLAFTSPVPASVSSSSSPVAGFRPMDAVLSRGSSGAEGRIIRSSLLGPIIDYLVEVGGATVRAQQLTEEAAARGLLFREGETCRVEFHDVHWFDGSKDKEDLA